MTKKFILNTVIERYYIIDLYHSNVGTCMPDNAAASLEYWDMMWNLNFIPHVIAAKKFVPIMLSAGYGHMMFTASAAGMLNMPGSATYGVTKSAIISYADFLAMTYGSRGLGIHCLCPQAVSTPLALDSCEYVDRLTDNGLTGKFMEPKELGIKTLDALQSGTHLISTHHQAISDQIHQKYQHNDEYVKGTQQMHDDCMLGLFIEGFYE